MYPQRLAWLHAVSSFSLPLWQWRAQENTALHQAIYSRGFIWDKQSDLKSRTDPALAKYLHTNEVGPQLSK